MKKIISSLILIIGFTYSIKAQISGFINEFTTSNINFSARSVSSHGTGYYVAGNSTSSSSDGFVAKTDNYGNHLWLKRVQYADNSEAALLVMTSSNGDALVTDNASNRLEIRRYGSSNGALVSVNFVNADIRPTSMKVVEINGVEYYGILGWSSSSSINFVLVDNAGVIQYAREYFCSYNQGTINSYIKWYDLGFTQKHDGNILIAYGSSQTFSTLEINEIDGLPIAVPHNNSFAFNSTVRISDIIEVSGVSSLGYNYLLSGEYGNKGFVALIDDAGNYLYGSVLNSTISNSYFSTIAAIKQNGNVIEFVEAIRTNPQNRPSRTCVGKITLGGSGISIVNALELEDQNSITGVSLASPLTLTTNNTTSFGEFVLPSTANGNNSATALVFLDQNQSLTCGITPQSFVPQSISTTGSYSITYPSNLSTTGTLSSQSNLNFNPINNYTCTSPCSGAIPGGITQTGGICSTGGGNVGLSFSAPVLGYSYLWSTGSISSSIIVSSAGTYGLTVTNSNTGCVSVLSANVIEDPDVEVTNYEIEPQTFGDYCLTDNPHSFVLYEPSPSTNPTYTWKVNGVQILGSTPTFTYTFASAGTYDVSVDITNACGTTTLIETVELIGIQPGTVSASVLQQPVCYQEDGVISFSGPYSGPAITIRLTDVNTNAVYTTPLTNIYIMNPGTYDIEAYYDDVPGCVDYVGQITINQPQSPTAITVDVLTQSDAFCLGYPNGEIEINATGGAGGYSYQWSNGASTSNIQNLAGGNYSYTVTDAVGCFTTGNVAIQNGTSPFNVDFSSIPVSCTGVTDGSATATVVPTPSPSTLYTFDWSDGTTDIGHNSTVNNLINGNYTVTVTAPGVACQVVQNISVDGPEARWHKRTFSQTGQGDNHVVKTLVDNNGFVYALGEFNGEVDLDGQIINAGAPNQDGIFVAQYDQCGNMVWVVNTSNPNNFDIDAIDMELITPNNVRVFGKLDLSSVFITPTIDIYINGIQINNPTSSLSELFSLDFDITNNLFVYSNIVGSGSFSDVINDVEMNGSDYYFAGVFGGNAEVIQYNVPTSTWSSIITAPGANNTFSALTIDGVSNNMYAVANLQSSTSIGATTVGVTGIRDAALVRCDLTTMLTTVSQAEGQDIFMHDVILTGNNELWLIGEFRGLVNNWTGLSVASNSPIIIEFDPSNLNHGDYFYGDPMFNTYTTARGLALTENNNHLYAAGTFVGNEIYFSDYQSPANFLMANNGSAVSDDMWLLHISSVTPNSTLVEAVGSHSNQDVIVSSIASNSDGSLAYIGGSYADQIDMDLVPLQHAGGPVLEGFVIRSGSGYGQLGYYKSKDQSTSSQEQPNIFESASTNNTVKLYPNPNNGDFTVELSSEKIGDIDLSIMDVSGKVIWTNDYDKSTEVFQVNIHPETIAKGMYFMHVFDGVTKNTIKFVVQ